MRSTLLCLVVLFVVTACKKDKVDIIWKCNYYDFPDSSTISAKLPGSWQWAKTHYSRPGGSKLADKNVIATLRADHTYTITENLNLISEGTWQLIQVDLDMWGILTSEPNGYLSGKIIFCENLVLFSDTYRDASDEFFYRVK